VEPNPRTQRPGLGGKSLGVGVFVFSVLIHGTLYRRRVTGPWRTNWSGTS